MVAGKVLAADAMALVMLVGMAGAGVWWRDSKRTIGTPPDAIRAEALQVQQEAADIARRGRPLPRLDASWRRARAAAAACGVELIGVVVEGAGATPAAAKRAYEGPRASWDGVLRGRAADVLQCAALLQRLVPMHVGVFNTASGSGEAALTVAVLGAPEDEGHDG